jgi:hypothetical protein
LSYSNDVECIRTPTLYHITDIFLPANQLTKKPGFFSITDSQKPGFSPKSLVVTDKLGKKPGFFSSMGIVSCGNKDLIG